MRQYYDLILELSGSVRDLLQVNMAALGGLLRRDVGAQEGAFKQEDFGFGDAGFMV